MTRNMGSIATSQCLRKQRRRDPIAPRFMHSPGEAT